MSYADTSQCDWSLTDASYPSPEPPFADSFHLEGPEEQADSTFDYGNVQNPYFENEIATCGVFPDTCDHRISGAAVIAAAPLIITRLGPQGIAAFFAVSILAHLGIVAPLFYHLFKNDEPNDEQYIEIVPMAVDNPPEQEPPSEVPVTEDQNVEIAVVKKMNPDKKIEEEVRKKKKEEIKEEPQTELTPIKSLSLHFVDIRNNESDTPPEDAHYFAPINSKVDEETRAENTNLDHDEGASILPENDSPESEEPGDAPESVVAHNTKEDESPLQEVGQENDPEEKKQPPQTTDPSLSSEEGKKQVQKILTPAIATPVDIEMGENAEFIDPKTGEPTAKTLGQGKKSKGPGIDMKLSPSQIGMWGMKMKEDEEAAEAAKKSHNKGKSTNITDNVAGQFENFIFEVKPGSQTALNAAFHPFAEYLTAFHRKLHAQWGEGYLKSLELQPASHPHNNMALYCKLEITINSDGTIAKVKVVHHSGDLAYDAAAVDAVYDGEPYPVPPDIVKSYDGKTYLHWGFHRNESQCGVWNAQPFILVDPDVPEDTVEKQP